MAESQRTVGRQPVALPVGHARIRLKPQLEPLPQQLLMELVLPKTVEQKGYVGLDQFSPIARVVARERPRRSSGDRRHGARVAGKEDGPIEDAVAARVDDGSAHRRDRWIIQCGGQGRRPALAERAVVLGARV